MSSTLSDRALALAGMLQALAQVRRIADSGQSDAAAERAVMDSVFRIDAPDTEAVYGRAADLAPGLRLLQDYFGNRLQDPALTRLAAAVLQLERRFVSEPDTVAAVRAGVEDLAAQAQANGSTHPDVLAALGVLYADTISHLRPRVMVTGNPHYLAQPGVVGEIRALLLAALRSAVLWRQSGGRAWDMLLSKRAMLEATQRWLR